MRRIGGLIGHDGRSDTVLRHDEVVFRHLGAYRFHERSIYVLVHVRHHLIVVVRLSLQNRLVGGKHLIVLNVLRKLVRCFHHLQNLVAATVLRSFFKGGSVHLDVDVLLSAAARIPGDVAEDVDGIARLVGEAEILVAVVHRRVEAQAVLEMVRHVIGRNGMAASYVDAHVGTQQRIEHGRGDLADTAARFLTVRALVDCLRLCPAVFRTPFAGGVVEAELFPRTKLDALHHADGLRDVLIPRDGVLRFLHRHAGGLLKTIGRGIRGQQRRAVLQVLHRYGRLGNGHIGRDGQRILSVIQRRLHLRENGGIVHLHSVRSRLIREVRLMVRLALDLIRLEQNRCRRILGMVRDLLIERIEGLLERLLGNRDRDGGFRAVCFGKHRFQSGIHVIGKPHVRSVQRLGIGIVLHRHGHVGKLLFHAVLHRSPCRFHRHAL